MKKLSISLALIAISLSTATQAATVKMSNSGICHDENSGSYSRTKNFTPYDSIEACLTAGGKAYKGYKAQEESSNTANSTDYDRSYFGHGWNEGENSDDCKDTRAEILARDSINAVGFATDKKCRVISGQWNSPFTGNKIYDATKTDIDHIVPLKFAWEHGAQLWDDEKRETFANDPINLVVVEASLNRSKGAQPPWEWLPPSNKCQYINHFQRVVLTYKLTLSEEEKLANAGLKKQHCSK